MSTKPDSGTRSPKADAMPASRSGDGGVGADRRGGGETPDHVQVSTDRALDHAVSETRDSGGPRQPRLEESSLYHAITGGSDRGGPSGAADGKSLGGQLSDALNHAAAAGKDLAHKAGDTLKGVSDRATDRAAKVGEGAVKIGKAVAVSGAVGYHVLEPAVGLAAQSPDYGPALEQASSSQQVESPSRIDRVVDAARPGEQAKDSLGISDHVEWAGDTQQKQQDDRTKALGDDRGHPESSVHGEPPDDYTFNH